MHAPIHILATVRNPALLDAALLVFKTLRIGFPRNEVKVWGNALSPEHSERVGAAARQAQADFRNLKPTAHGTWIESLVQTQLRPFWICDTDIVFSGPLEPMFGAHCLAGRLEPAFDEAWTGTLHVERLHPSLMWINPAVLRAEMRAMMTKIPWRPMDGDCPLILPHFIPRRGKSTLFYDATAGLWQAGIGTPFTEAYNQAYEHLHNGTYVDLIGPSLGLGDLAEAHRKICANPALVKGIRAEQDKYYAGRKPKELTHVH
jgi:hypothetical protein